GTLILITHDRMLLDHLVDQLLVFDGDGGCTHFLGTYSEWLDQQTAPPKAEPPKPQLKKPSKTKPKQKNKKSSNASAQMSQAKLESEIERLEARLHEIDFALMDPAVFADGEQVKALQAERADQQEQLKPLEREWAARAG
ncbi:MAG: hypothetical protein AAF800_13280, partial [Planctomycetota bacterium]